MEATVTGQPVLSSKFPISGKCRGVNLAKQKAAYSSALQQLQSCDQTHQLLRPKEGCRNLEGQKGALKPVAAQSRDYPPEGWQNTQRPRKPQSPSRRKIPGRDEPIIDSGQGNGAQRKIPGRDEPFIDGRQGNGALASQPAFNGVFLILLLNVVAFVADHFLKLPAMKWLYLNHASARWYQFVTSTFCHASWNHLSSNLFFLYIFGRLVEEEEGSVGLWATYLVTGAGANIVSWLILPRSVVSVGASGAVFGLFAVSVLTRLRFNWRKLLEVVILGQFVIERLIVEAQSGLGKEAIFSSGGVNHVAHLAGALVGVILIWLVSKIPESDDTKARPG